MNKHILLFFTLFGFLAGTSIAQSPNSINYQGVARDASGTPVANQAIGLEITIRSGSATGTVEYQETHAVTTSDLGLFTLMIGTGTTVSGTFASIDWANNSHFVEVGMDPTGGTSYTAVGTSELVSVPYALHATTVENDAVDDADADPANEFNSSINLTGTILAITDGGGSLTQDLSSLQDGVDDADADSTNELNTAFVLTGTNLSLTDAAGTLTVDLSSLGGGGGGLWTAAGSNIYYNTGNVGIGATNPLKQLTVESNTLPEIALGNNTFNQVESGRLTFSEDIDNTGGDCGFQFHMDGSANTLTLVSGCFIPTAGDTAFIVTRASAYTNFKNRIKVGDINNPLANLHIKQDGNLTTPGSSGLRLEERTTTNQWQVWTGSSFLNFAFNGTRVSYINNTNGAYTQVSDARFKNNVTPMNNVLKGVMALNPVEYYYNHHTDGAKVKGFIAQEVEEVFPEMVSISPGTDHRALSYSDFGVISIKAIQEQQEIIDAQQDEIDALKAQVEELMELKKMVEELKK